jgi:hypothetical protein
VASFDQAVVCGVDQGPPARPAPEAVVLEPDIIVEPAELAAHRHLAAGQQRPGVALAELGPPGELAAHRIGLDEDVGDLARKAGNVERGGVDDLDPGDVRSRDPSQFGEDVVRLAGNPVAVDQDVAGGGPQPPLLGRLADGEAGDVAQHVERVARREAGEIGGKEGLGTLDRRRKGRFGRR